jgi:hypothetical protein
MVCVETGGEGPHFQVFFDDKLLFEANDETFRTQVKWGSGRRLIV